MAQADWTISNRLPFDESWRDPAAAWVNADYFRIYQEVEGEPWLALFVRNYLTYNPIRKNRNYGHGYVLIQDCECYMVADCTGDGATDLKDFAMFARLYHAPQTTPTKRNDSPSRRGYPCSEEAYGPGWFEVSYDLVSCGGDDGGTGICAEAESSRAGMFSMQAEIGRTEQWRVPGMPQRLPAKEAA